MSFIDTIIKLKKEVDEFQAIEWTLTSAIVVGLFFSFLYRKNIFIFARILFDAKNILKYFYDKSVSFDGETYLLSFNNSVTTDEVKQLKRYESLTRIKIYRDDEESNYIKLSLETSLKDAKISDRDSHLIIKNDIPESLTIRLSNSTFDSLYKSFHEKDMRVFVKFTAYKSLTYKSIDYYNFSSLDFEILETDDFRIKVSMMMFKEFIEPELAKIKETEVAN